MPGPVRSNGLVRIYSRYGDIVEEFSITDSVSTLNWDKHGELLAITNVRSPTLVLYEFSVNNVHTIDISVSAKNMPTFVCWSPTQSVLLIGDNRGNITMYNHRTSRKIPIMGKHQRSILCGSFNSEGTNFVLGSNDCTITISGAEDGDTLNVLMCNGEPTCLRVAKIQKLDDTESDKPEDFVSAVIDQRTLMIAKINQSERPTNLQFQDKYGDIVSTEWYGNGNILLGFEFGYIVAIATETSADVSQELFSVQDFNGQLSSLTINAAFGMALFIGNNILKIRDLYDLKQLTDIINVESEDKVLCAVSTTEDGSLTAVSGKDGSLSVYLTKLPIMAAAYQSCVAVLSSLTEITIYRDAELQPFHTLNLRSEPSLIVMGPNHIAVVYNHRASFYQICRNSSILVYEHDFLTTVTKMRLNGEYAIVHVDDKIQLHKVPKLSAGDSYGSSQNVDEFDAMDCRVFPNDDANNVSYAGSNPPQIRILDAELSEKFLIYSTNLRYIHYFSLANERAIGDFRHVCEVRRLFAETEGIRLCFIDERRDAYVYNPVGDLLTQIPNVLSPLHGIVFCNTHDGRTNTILLKSHQTNFVFDGKSHEELLELLNQSLALKRWRTAWRISEFMKEASAWQIFSKAALEDMNIELAIRIFRNIGNVAMVWTLEELRFTEDQNLLAGHVAGLLGQFDEADELFCRAGQPILALNMRRDIQHWDRALELAEKFASAELPSISKEYAVQLELLGKHEEALHHYELALNAFVNRGDKRGDMEGDQNVENEQICRSGAARMALRVGDIQRGVQLALQVPDRLIKRDCGLILEQMKQFEEAGKLYENGEFYERAAAAFLRCKNWIKVNELIANVRSPKILRQYAKTLANEKKYEKAYEIYKRALDYDNMILLLLKYLNRPEEAIRIAQESRSIEGAKMVAKFFTDLGNNESAIEFLVLSQCFQEAYELAESRDCMKVYANAVEPTGNISLFAQLAGYFFAENNRDLLMAGKFAGLAKNYTTAVDHLIKASTGKLSGDDSAIQYAVEFAAESGNKPLIFQLIDHLMGETDGIPKDPKYLFQLYVRLKMYAEAAKTAVIIAQDQQSKGFYKSAHDLLFEMYKTLREQKIKISSEMEDGLQLLHSYIIVKNLIKSDENVIAARLLIRISTNISQFPAHATQILTSAVITCSKAGLKASAFKFASQLLQPKYRQKMDEKYKKKIETIVRKSERDIKDEEEERQSPCPFCEAPVDEFTLLCDACKSLLPYCIVTGRHIVASDFSFCPTCSFPAYYSEFIKLIRQGDSRCPMCHTPLTNILPRKFNAANYI